MMDKNEALDLYYSNLFVESDYSFLRQFDDFDLEDKLYFLLTEKQ